MFAYFPQAYQSMLKRSRNLSGTTWPRARFDRRARCTAGPVSRPMRLVARPQDDQDARCGQHAPEWPSALPGATARVLGHALGIAGRLVSQVCALRAVWRAFWLDDMRVAETGG
jgi:hypothetical protein